MSKKPPLRVVEKGSEKQTNEFEAKNRFRLLAYELIRDGFSYPDKKRIERMQNTPLRELTDEDEVLSFLGDIPPLSHLETIYTTYFDVVFNEKGCHLREGEYLKNKGAISKLLLECKGFYKNFGLYLAPNELPDSLDVELEFMYYLTYLILKELSSNRKDHRERIISILTAQRDFLNRHLMPFMSAVSECLKKYDELSFYSKLASFANEFLSFEREFIESSLSNMRKTENDT